MRFRWLTVFPLLYAGAFVLIAGWLAGGDAWTPFVRGQLLLVRALAIAGCFLAASVFGRRDHLRRAWMWLGVATVLVLVRDLLRLPPFEVQATGGGIGPLVTSGLGILSNVGLLGGIFLLARAWKVVALAVPGGRASVVAVVVVAGLLSLAVAGPGAVRHARELVAGDEGALILFVSAVVDILSLWLLAPLLLTALALRGGVFAWPWGLVTVSVLSWLLYDAAAALPAGLVAAGLALPDVFRGLAENYLFAAGVAQFLVVRQVRQAAEGGGAPREVAEQAPVG